MIKVDKKQARKKERKKKERKKEIEKNEHTISKDKRKLCFLRQIKMLSEDEN